MSSFRPLAWRLRLVCLLLCSAAGAVGAESAPLVRVLLAVGDAITLTFEGAHTGVLDGVEFATPVGLEWPIARVGDALAIDGLVVGRVLELGSSEGVLWNGTRYRGSLRLIAEAERILVVNVLDLESYLRGVVPAEMHANWHLEALKAQAVAARSYTLRYLKADGAYDICATIDCQVYAGVVAEHPRSDAAVLATAGEIVTYAGRVARVYYHSDSGGATASSAEVWGYALPYLPARRDVATRSPHAQWSARIQPQVAVNWLATIGVSIGALESLRVLETSASGRVVRAELIGSRGRVVLAGAVLTAQLRGWGLRSTRFEMTGPLSVRGQGWGHGVGMSQWGALAMAESGHGYRSILANYYPGTVLETVAALRERDAALAETP